MVLRSACGSPYFILHVKPTVPRESVYGGRHVAALMLLVEQGRQPLLDPELVASALGLTPTESLVAVWLAEGKTVREIAVATGRKETSVYWRLRQIYSKHGISRQAALVRLVLSIAAFA